MADEELLTQVEVKKRLKMKVVGVALAREKVTF